MIKNIQKTGKVGKGNPPAETRFKKGNPGGPGRPKGTPNRSTIARLVLEMKVQPPDQILRNLKAMYPQFFQKKTKKWTNEFVAYLRVMQKAILRGDAKALEALLDSAYGKALARSEIELGLERELKEELKRISELIIDVHKRKNNQAGKAGN